MDFPTVYDGLSRTKINSVKVARGVYLLPRFVDGKFSHWQPNATCHRTKSSSIESSTWIPFGDKFLAQRIPYEDYVILGGAGDILDVLFLYKKEWDRRFIPKSLYFENFSKDEDFRGLFKLKNEHELLNNFSDFYLSGDIDDERKNAIASGFHRMGFVNLSHIRSINEESVKLRLSEVLPVWGGFMFNVLGLSLIERRATDEEADGYLLAIRKAKLIERFNVFRESEIVASSSVVADHYRNFVLASRKLQAMDNNNLDEFVTMVDGQIAKAKKYLEAHSLVDEVSDFDVERIEFKTKPLFFTSKNMKDEFAGVHRVRFNPISGEIKILSAIDGLPNHPHVSSDGTPCFGQFKPLLLESVKSFDVCTVIDCILELLQSYNPGSPYRHWDSVKEQLPEIFSQFTK